MYYNDVSFPIFLYKFNLETISSEAALEKISFFIKQKNFESDFKRVVKERIDQDLFGYLVTTLPSVILSDLKKFTKKDFPNIDNRVKVLSNIRLDMIALNKYLSDLSQNPYCKSVEIDAFVNEIINFVFQYTFVELSNCIVASKSENGNLYYFNIISDSKKYYTYIASKSKTTSPDRIAGRKIYRNNFLKSFDLGDEDKRKEVENDLLFMSKRANQKKRLRSIFDRNIIFDDGITSHKKNAIFRFYFKNIIAKFFFSKLEEFTLDDIDVLDVSRQFLKRSR
jgi:hypothetical protein